MNPAGLSGDSEQAVGPFAEWTSLRLDQVSTPAGELVEYRPTADVVSVATGASRAIEVVEANAPPRHIDVSPGQVHILPANVPVGIRLFGRADNIVVSLNHRLLSEAMPRRGSLEVELRSAFGLEDGLIQQLVYALQAEATSPSPDAQYVESLGAALAAHLVRKYASDGQRRPTRARVVKPGLTAVIDFIDQNIDGKLTLPKLASVARLSVFAFVRSFKSGTGLPPHRYVLRRRIERAKVLLADAALNIADVALRCGFGDQSAFTTTFRRLTLQTPSAFREGLRGQRIVHASVEPLSAQMEAARRALSRNRPV
jgi:AraC family transcriptional regulator